MRHYSFGPKFDKGQITFRLWAPFQQQIGLRIEGQPDRSMRREADGWHSVSVARTDAPLRYGFVLEDGRTVPDPASRYQPDGPHGLSEAIDLDNRDRYPWKGRPWEETVIYELHIGTFTPAGTFAAAIDKLDHLADLGVTALQLMPLSDFPGSRGWGYDGVLPYAPYHSYGRPEDLQQLIDEAHKRRLSVLLDVVYNHFGPDGNFFPAYAPIVTDRHSSTWGDGINLDGEDSRFVRDYFIENALYWLDVYGFDGLRFDAVHVLRDDSEPHFLKEMATRLRTAFPASHLIVENDNNDSALLERDQDGKPVLFTAQWNDDVHHTLHPTFTGERSGYYADFATRPEAIGRALAEGFFYQGETVPSRGTPRGQPSAHLPPTAFISFLQNHDQIGNRPQGDRPVLTGAQKRALSAVHLLLPQIPMIFMGEEWDSQRPFPYFCDFDDAMNDRIRKGREEELSRMATAEGEIVDPAAPETFQSAVLDWASIPENIACLDYYRQLLDRRCATIVPLLPQIKSGGRFHMIGHLAEVQWQTDDGRTLTLAANLSDEPAAYAGPARGEVLWQEGEITSAACGPWAVVWTLA